MSYLGSWKIDDYLPIPVTTHRFSSGAAYAPTSLTYSIYEDSTTTGLDEDVDMTPASPFDSITGFYLARRQLTAAAGFEKGKNYTVLIKATVDSVAAIAAHTFQIEAEVDSNTVSGTVGTTTNLTNLPAATADWLTANAVKADAVTKIQNGLATPTNITAGTITTVTNVTNGVTLANDAITAAKFDESTAFPVKSADTGATAIARVGADSDTLETLSDQLDAVKAETAAIVADTNELQVEWADGGRLDLILDAAGSAGDPWTTILPGTYGAGSAGKALSDVLEDTGTTLNNKIDAIDDYIDTEVAAIKAKTDLITTGTTITLASPVSGSTITVQRGDTLSAALENIGSLLNHSKIYFTAKWDSADADSVSLIQIEHTAGLLYINGAAAVTAGNGTLAVNDEATGDVTIGLAAAETAKLEPGSYSYDIQIVRSAGTPVSTLTTGTLTVTADYTRAVA